MRGHKELSYVEDGSIKGIAFKRRIVEG